MGWFILCLCCATENHCTIASIKVAVTCLLLQPASLWSLFSFFGLKLSVALSQPELMNSSIVWLSHKEPHFYFLLFLLVLSFDCVGGGSIWCRRADVPGSTNWCRSWFNIDHTVVMETPSHHSALTTITSWPWPVSLSGQLWCHNGVIGQIQCWSWTSPTWGYQLMERNREDQREFLSLLM